MITAVLFDLDDTLLGNNMETFIPRYFALLGEHASRYMPRQQFLEELMICTRAMVPQTAVTNREAFWHLFHERTGLDPEEIEPFFDQFYRETFPQLEAVTQKRPEAVELVRVCFDLGLKIVVATNPLFPRRAIEHRLAWAGLPVNENAFALVTTYENMHAAKPTPAYYQEILATIECQPADTLMVGDNWVNDIQPAAGLGIKTFWVPPDESSPPDEALLNGFGSLAALLELVQSGWLTTLS
jgi:HAD superfamily hydrolase (TIGR01549 family)